MNCKDCIEFPNEPSAQRCKLDIRLSLVGGLGCKMYARQRTLGDMVAPGEKESTTRKENAMTITGESRSCKKCYWYPRESKQLHCNTGRLLFASEFAVCNEYTEDETLEDMLPPGEPDPPIRIKIAVGSDDCLSLRRGVWALHKIRHLRASTAIHLLALLGCDAGEVEKWVGEWEKYRCDFRANAIHTPQDFCAQKHWREALDALREQFMAGEVDTDIVLAALDPQDTGSESVKDLIHSWEIEFWSSVADADGLAVAREMSGDPVIPF